MSALAIVIILSIVGTITIITLIFRPSILRAKKLNSSYAELVKSGFKIDHTIHGIGAHIAVHFDDTAKKVFFICPDIRIDHDYADIIDWRFDSKSKNTENVFSFTLKDKNRPLIKVELPSRNAAEFWMAKMKAILNY